jgi:hypothetical protein
VAKRGSAVRTRKLVPPSESVVGQVIDLSRETSAESTTAPGSGVLSAEDANVPDRFYQKSKSKSAPRPIRRDKGRGDGCLVYEDDDGAIKKLTNAHVIVDTTGQVMGKGVDGALRSCRKPVGKMKDWGLRFSLAKKPYRLYIKEIFPGSKAFAFAQECPWLQKGRVLSGISDRGPAPTPSALTNIIESQDTSEITAAWEQVRKQAMAMAFSTETLKI